ncbi:RPB5 subunit of DNA-directed RNA polymerase [Fistulina hepatica ATCC 64428]|nr:RPB5 subunit of DNA-directed RNA polymerase [Fistulina hepatica ATCC 64428]
MSDDDSARLWRVNRTIHELVRDRGYAVADEELNIDLQTFRNTYSNGMGTVDRNALNFFTNKVDNPREQIFIYFCQEKSVGVKELRVLFQIMNTKDITRGIIIYTQSITSSAKKALGTDISKKGFLVEDFAEADLLVNIMHHTLVPQHIVLSIEEKRELLEKYRLKETQLPRIQIGDPVARYLGLRRGQVVKIIRPSETSGRYASYRICF